MRFLLLIALLISSGCRTKLEREKAEYFAAIKKADQGYFSDDVNRAYQSVNELIAFFEERKKTGEYLANPNVLMWEYPRLALLAEYCGRDEESVRLFAKAEQYARSVYPDDPPETTSAAALRDAMERITTGEKVPWKIVKKEPNQ